MLRAGSPLRQAWGGDVGATARSRVLAEESAEIRTIDPQQVVQEGGGHRKVPGERIRHQRLEGHASVARRRRLNGEALVCLYVLYQGQELGGQGSEGLRVCTLFVDARRNLYDRIVRQVGKCAVVAYVHHLDVACSVVQ